MSIVLKLGKICVTNESLGVSVTCTTEAIAWRGGGGRGAQNPGSGKVCEKNEYYNKKPNFLHTTNFELLSQIQGNFINNCDFLKFIIYVRGG